MKYSILLTTYDPEGKLHDMINKCVSHIKENAGTQDYQLLTDNLPGGGGQAWNRLIEQARGEYLVFMNDDIFISEPNFLEKMAMPNAIVTWRMGRFFVNGEIFPSMDLICIPKNVQEKIGLFDEQFGKGYGFDDNDYMHRASLLNVPFIEVPIRLEHLEGKTFKTYYSQTEKSEMMQKNRELYWKKWNLDSNGNYT